MMLVHLEHLEHLPHPPHVRRDHVVPDGADQRGGGRKGGNSSSTTMPITRLQLKCCCLSWCIGLAIPGHRSVARHHHHGAPPGGGAGSPSPASRMGRRVKRSRELALETISGTLKTSMPRGRLHVLSYQPGPSPRFGIALDYRAADMSHGTTSPFQVTGGPPTIC